MLFERKHWKNLRVIVEKSFLREMQILFISLLFQGTFISCDRNLDYIRGRKWIFIFLLNDSLVAPKSESFLFQWLFFHCKIGSMCLKWWRSSPATAQALSDSCHLCSRSSLGSMEVMLYLAVFLSTGRISCAWPQKQKASFLTQSRF